jgi:hypothetical protein
MLTTTIQQIFFDSLVIFFFVLGFVAAAVGVGLLVCGAKMNRLFVAMNRYVSTRHGLKSVSVQHDISPIVQRYRLWFGAVIMAGAAYSLFSLIVIFDTGAITSAFVSTADAGMSHSFAFCVVESLRWFMVVLSLIALVIGGLLVFSPATLSRVEAYANRWYSVRKATLGVDNANLTLDRWVETFPRAAGLAILLGALIVIISSGITLF